MVKKKILFALIFVYILFSQVFPPVFSKNLHYLIEENSLFLPNFDLISILFYVFYCVIFSLICKQYGFWQNKAKLKTCILNSFFSLLAILAIWLIFSILGGENMQNEQAQKNCTNFLFFLCLFCASAFEESLYRFYLPKSVQFFLQNATLQGKIAQFEIKKIIQFIMEILIVLLFGFAHKYLGVLAVFNAILAGSILRLLAIKSNFFCCTLVHSIYNCIIFAFFC